MNSKTDEVTYCKKYRDIYDGLVPDVIISFEESQSRAPVYTDSLKVAVGKMSRQEYLELYSPYYKLNPHLKTFHTS